MIYFLIMKFRVMSNLVEEVVDKNKKIIIEAFDNL